MWIDIVFLIVLSLSFYRGYKKGLIKTVFTVLAILVAIIITLKFSPYLINIFADSFKFSDGLAFISGTTACFLLAYFAINMAGKLVEKLLKTLHINFINKIAGGVLGGFISVVILSFTVSFFDGFGIIPELLKENSFSYDLMKEIPEILRMNMEKLRPYFEEFWDLASKAFAND